MRGCCSSVDVGDRACSGEYDNQTKALISFSCIEIKRINLTAGITKLAGRDGPYTSIGVVLVKVSKSKKKIEITFKKYSSFNIDYLHVQQVSKTVVRL